LLRTFLFICLLAILGISVYATVLTFRVLDALVVEPVSQAAQSLAAPANLAIDTLKRGGNIALTGTNTLLRLGQSGAAAAAIAASLSLYSLRLARETLAFLTAPSLSSSPIPLSLRVSAQKLRLLLAEVSKSSSPIRAAPAEAPPPPPSSLARVQSLFSSARQALWEHRLLAWAAPEQD